MPKLTPLTRLEGLPRAAELELVRVINAIVEALKSPVPLGVVSEQTAAFAATAGDVCRVRAGGTLSLPPPNATTAGKTVVLLVEGQGSVSVVSRPATLAGGLVQGTVDGASLLAVGGPGACIFTSNGAGGWASMSSSSSGAAAAAADDDTEAGNALAFAGNRLDLVGSRSNLNRASASGALGVINISSLECGGTLSIQGVSADATIDGFTARNPGFFFFLNIRDATTADFVVLLEDVGSLSTSIRTPNARDWRLTKSETCIMSWTNNRWRVVGVRDKFFLTPSDSVTFAAAQDNYQRTSLESKTLNHADRAQTLSGIVPEELINRRADIDSEHRPVDTLTLRMT
jgi:hypothetical protein